MPETTARLGCKHLKLNMDGGTNLFKSLEQLYYQWINTKTQRQNIAIKTREMQNGHKDRIAVRKTGKKRLKVCNRRQDVKYLLFVNIYCLLYLLILIFMVCIVCKIIN